MIQLSSISQNAMVAVQKVHVDLSLQQQQAQRIPQSGDVQTIRNQTLIGEEETSDQVAAVELPAECQQNLQDASISPDEGQIDSVEELTQESQDNLSVSSSEQIQTWQTRDYTSLHLQWRIVDKCADDCTCLCHVLRRPLQRFRTPQFLKGVIGYLFARYSGLLFLQLRCSSRDCRNYSASLVRITYCFPKWAFAAAIHVAAGTTTLGVPMSLFVQRRVDGWEENGIMDLIRKDDLEGVKTLFMKRLASPSDADFRGHTTLHVSIHIPMGVRPDDS